jgi:hypothetical protein
MYECVSFIHIGTTMFTVLLEMREGEYKLERQCQCVYV